MSDLIDEAHETEELLRGAALKSALARNAGDGSDHCVDCGEPIPEARRAAVPEAERCVLCQERFERR